MLAHATALRALNECLEDHPSYNADDLRTVFNLYLCQLLGMSSLDVSPAPPAHRMTAREVRAVFYRVLDRSLPAQTVLALMHGLDAAMAELAVKL